MNLNWITGQQDFTSVTQLPNNFQVASPSITFPSPVSTLTITAFDGSNAQVRLFMDNLNITAISVPEPTTVALLGMTVAALGYAAYRYRLHRLDCGEQPVEEPTN